MKWWEAIRSLPRKRSTLLGRHTLASAGGVLLVSMLLTIAMAAPVLLHPSKRVFGSEIEGRHPDPFTVIEQFEHPRLPGTYTQPATDYPGAALAALFGGGVVAYNLVVLVSFPLAALFAFLLALRLTDSMTASWFAGLVYAFAPFHVAHAAYHPQVAQIQWLPLFFLSLWLSLGRATASRLLLLGLSSLLVVMSNFYYGFIAALLTPLAVVGFCLCLRRSRPGWELRRNVVPTVSILLGVAVAGLAWIVAFAPRVLFEPTALAFPEGDLRLYSARWFSYLLPPWEHPLFGRAVELFWEGRGLPGLVEQQLTLGVGLLSLASLPLVARLRGRRDESLAAVPALVLLLVAAASLSVFTPATGFLYRFLPMFRAYARFGVVVLLVVAVLGGLGLDLLRRHAGRRTAVAASVLIALVAVELAPVPPWRWRDVLPTAAHRWLDNQGGAVSVVDCVPSRYVAQRVPPGLFSHQSRLLGPSEDCGDPDFAASLASQRVTHAIVRRSSPLASWFDEHDPSEGLRLERRFDDSLLFTVEPEVPPVFLEIDSGFYWREYVRGRSYRWMGESGKLSVVNTTYGYLEASVELELQGFPRARVLAIWLDGHYIDDMAIYPLPRSQVIGPLRVPPGRHTLELATRTPARRADEVLDNGDQRLLALSLGRWSVQPVGD